MDNLNKVIPINLAFLRSLWESFTAFAILLHHNVAVYDRIDFSLATTKSREAH